MSAALRRAAALASFGPLLLAGSPQGSPPPAIAEWDQAWRRAYAEADWRTLRALYAPDVWQLSDKAPTLSGAEAVLANLKAYRAAGAQIGIERHIEQLTLDRGRAIEVSSYRMNARLPGRPVATSAGRALRIFVRSGGAWRLWREMDNTGPQLP